MELSLQFGWGMMEHCRHLLAAWNGGTAILSPRDLTDEQLYRFSSDIHEIGNARLYLDPQFYLPHADHERLCGHDYWPNSYDTGTFWQGHSLNILLTKLRDLNNNLETFGFILPGILAQKIDDDWLEIQRMIIEEAVNLLTNRPIIATIALSAEALSDESQITRLIEESDNWNPNGYYLVFEHPKGMYLVDDPIWLTNVLDLVASLKMQGRITIVGYCNHQMLILAAAKADYIASGTWMNVRSFPPDKFRTAYDDEIKQRATWYYCPQALSEYKLPFLDVAHRMGILNLMRPNISFDAGYVSQLIGETRPSTIGLTEQAAFRHYLHSLAIQTREAEKATFDDTIASHLAILSNAEDILNTLRTSGVSGQLRDFAEIIDVNRAALGLFVNQRGIMLRRNWANL